MTTEVAASFATRLANGSNHVVSDFGPDSAALLVLFGGIAGGVSMPVFEFFRMTAAYPTKKLYLRDPLRGWYLRGLPGIGPDATAVARFLERQIERSGARRVVMAGASAGGFAALLFGGLLGVDEVHAFSPQTFVDEANRRRHDDARWPDQIGALHAALGPTSPLFDLATVPQFQTGSAPRHIHVSRDDGLDLRHARHLAHLPAFVLHEYDGGGHKLVKWLRNSGALETILKNALATDDRLLLPGSGGA